MFDIVTSKYPENRCFECFSPDHILLTYLQAKSLIENIASNLVSMGIKKGDRVAVTGKNSPQWALAYMVALSSPNV